jgi:hypothetical protein
MSSSAEMFVASESTPSHYDAHMWERAKSGMVAATVVAVAAVALVGGAGAGGPAAGRPQQPQGLMGSVLYATPSCEVRRLSLASLRSQAVTTDGGHCRFWPSPDGRLLAMHPGRPFIAPSRLQVLDLDTGRTVMPFRHPDLAVAPPAWSPRSDVLATCDGSRPGGTVREWRAGHTVVVVHRACFPGFVGGRLAYRLVPGGGRVAVGWHTVADAGSLGKLLGEGVTQVPGIAAAGDVLAVPATRTTTEPGSATTVIVFFDAAGDTTGVWDTGRPAREIGLTGGGRIAWCRTASGVIARAVAGGRTLGVSLHAVSAAASPDGATTVFSTGGALVFVDTAGGGELGRVPVRAGWLAWLQAGTAASSSGV